MQDKNHSSPRVHLRSSGGHRQFDEASTSGDLPRATRLFLELWKRFSLDPKILATMRDLVSTLPGEDLSRDTAEGQVEVTRDGPAYDDAFPSDDADYRQSAILTHVKKAEEQTQALQTQQIKELQALLDYLTGRTTGTYEGNKALARRVSIMAVNAGSVLLYTGEVQSRTGGAVSYDDCPVTIACLNAGVRSFKLRTADYAQKHVLTTKVWPPLKARIPSANSTPTT